MKKERCFDVLQVVEDELVLGHAKGPVEDVGGRLGHQVFLLVIRIRHVDRDQLVVGREKIRFEREHRTWGRKGGGGDERDLRMYTSL